MILLIYSYFLYENYAWMLFSREVVFLFILKETTIVNSNIGTESSSDPPSWAANRLLRATSIQLNYLLMSWCGRHSWTLGRCYCDWYLLHRCFPSCCCCLFGIFPTALFGCTLAWQLLLILAVKSLTVFFETFENHFISLSLPLSKAPQQNDLLFIIASLSNVKRSQKFPLPHSFQGLLKHNFLGVYTFQPLNKGLGQSSPVDPLK